MNGVLAVLLVLACAWGGWGEYRLQAQAAQHDKSAAAAALAHSDALDKQRKEDKDERDRQALVLDKAHAEALRWQADALRAERAGAGLRAEAGALRDRLAAADDALAGQCAPATEAAGVLADLLLECSDRRRAVSRYGDAAGAAGSTCASYYGRRPEGVTEAHP